MAAEIPGWIGPVATSFLFILIIIFVFWYYCYWRPKKEKQKREQLSKQTHAVLKLNTSLSTGRGCGTNSPTKHPLGGSLSHKYDEEAVYGGYVGVTGYSTSLIGVNYGSYCLEYCPIPETNPQPMCYEYKERPVFHYNAKIQHAGSPKVGTRTVGSRCKKPERAYCASHMKKCMKGECVKCPSLPVIMEGESLTSLCEEANEVKFSEVRQVGEGSFTCSCVGDAEEASVAIETDKLLQVELPHNQDEPAEHSDGSADSGYDAN